MDLNLAKYSPDYGFGEAKQACIKLERDGEFYVKNIGELKELHIDGVEVLPGKTKRLRNTSFLNVIHFFSS